MTDQQQLAKRLAGVNEAIAAAATRVGRDPASVDLLAVSKRHPVEVVRAAIAVGLTHFGENFAQELSQKRELIDDDVQWHFIGKLQRNKVKMLVGVVDLIHAVDSERLANAISRRAEAVGVRQRVLLSVNVAGEESKSGVSMAAAAELLQHIRGLESVVCDGLMAMPPLAEDPEQNRRHFRAVTALRDELRTSENPLPVLSMGTSGDFAVAVEEGATLVRVGTAIFGPRSYTQPKE